MHKPFSFKMAHAFIQVQQLLREAAILIMIPDFLAS